MSWICACAREKHRENHRVEENIFCDVCSMSDTNRPISSMSCVYGFLHKILRVFFKKAIFFKSLSERLDALCTLLSTNPMLIFAYKGLTMMKIKVFPTPLYRSVCLEFPRAVLLVDIFGRVSIYGSSVWSALCAKIIYVKYNVWKVI